MLTSSGNVDIWLLAGCGFGLYSFVKGFRIYREYRVLEDTPEVPIRSIAMGLVHVHGKAQADEQVPSPVSHTPCYFYQVVVEKWQSNPKGGGSWHHYGTVADGLKFCLEDASGRVLVDAHGAEFDLVETARREIGGLGVSLRRFVESRQDEEARLAAAVAASTSGGPATDTELRAFAAQAHVRGGSSPSFGLSGFNLSPALTLGGLGTASGRFRFTEYCISPGHWFDVTGTCAENPAPKDENDRNLIMKGQNEPTFLISWRSEKSLESKLRWRAALYVFGGGALAVACVAIFLALNGWW